jgi:HNH endonuclease
MSTRYISEKIRREVQKRAKNCCEYCLMHQDDSFYTFQIDHIISLKHGGLTVLDNLALSCFPCNSDKGSDIGTILLPKMVFVRLFNPRIDIWAEHFEVFEGSFYPKTEIGEATIKILNLNEIDKIIERQVLL